MTDPKHPDTDPRLMSLRRKLCEQSADLVNTVKIPPAVLAGELINVAVALPISMGVPPGDVAAILRQAAAAVDDGQDCAAVMN